MENPISPSLEKKWGDKRGSKLRSHCKRALSFPKECGGLNGRFLKYDSFSPCPALKFGRMRDHIKSKCSYWQQSMFRITEEQCTRYGSLCLRRPSVLTPDTKGGRTRGHKWHQVKYNTVINKILLFFCPIICDKW